MFEDTSSTDKDEIQSSIDKQAEVRNLVLGYPDPVVKPNPEPEPVINKKPNPTLD